MGPQRGISVRCQGRPSKQTSPRHLSSRPLPHQRDKLTWWHHTKGPTRTVNTRRCCSHQAGQGGHRRARPPPRRPHRGTVLQLLGFYRLTPSPSHLARNPSHILRINHFQTSPPAVREGKHSTSWWPQREMGQIWRKMGFYRAAGNDPSKLPTEKWCYISWSWMEIRRVFPEDA